MAVIKFQLASPAVAEIQLPASLELDDTGDLTLKLSGVVLLYVTTEGRLIRDHLTPNEIPGIRLDDQHRIEIES